MRRIKALTLIVALGLVVYLAAAAEGTPVPAGNRVQIVEPISTQVVLAAQAKAPQLEASKLSARAAILMDADSGEILFEKNANAQLPPASTTKIMTLVLGLERGGLGEMVSVPDSAGKVPADSTVVPVRPGERMQYRDLLYSLMIKSGNDAANAIATLTSGSVANFVEDMNARAEAMGLKNTHFVNAHGYPAPGHYSSARDLAKLTRAALKDGNFRKIVSTRSYTMGATALRQEKTLRNGYAILDESSEYYYPGAFGVKTGYSVSSGQCYVGAATRNGRTLISVVLHSALTKPEKWIDTARLFDYGFGR